MEVGIIVGVIGIVFAPLLAYLAAARKLSGKIATSEAADLWDESAAIRADYRDRLNAANERIERLAERLSRVEGTNLQLREQNFELTTTITSMNRTIDALKGKVEFLENENKSLRQDLLDKKYELQEERSV